MLNATSQMRIDHAEKRDYHRMQVALEVEFQIAETGDAGAGTTVNLSSRGICVTTDTPVKTGQTLALTVRGGTAGWEPLRATGVVTRSELSDDQLYQVACTLQNVQ